ncbi:MAG: hypothetical protein IID37_06255 [Planctomycetes bacterium]|nr:hypothetical protein [Planctomycetota bacterium]
MNGFMGVTGSPRSGLAARSNGVGLLMVVGIGMALSAWGCGAVSVKPVRVTNERLGRLAIGVAPAMNFSGSADFDPNRVADLMASELGYVEKVDVIPLSRTLAVLARQGRTEIESPGHALEVARQLGADALLLFAITEYQPYEPPVVGIAAQLYGVQRRDQGGRVDPIRVTRQASPFGGATGADSFGLLAQSEQVFDASHDSVVERIKGYNRWRRADTSPFGWRKVVVSQTEYLRFCCHETVRALMEPGPEGSANEPAVTEERR